MGILASPLSRRAYSKCLTSRCVSFNRLFVSLSKGTATLSVPRVATTPRPPYRVPHQRFPDVAKGNGSQHRPV